MPPALETLHAGLRRWVGVALALAGVLVAAQDATRAPGSGIDGATGQRVALVIGNNAYRSAPLANPVNDARAMADALGAAGFQVTLRTDSGHRDVLLALREFGDALRRGGVGLFYFAGHGMQIKGRNYLIPVDAVIEREDEVAYAAVDAQAVLDKMETAGNAANLMILDACRNNPFGRSLRSSSAGLAPMEAPVGTLVAFATAPGAVASDGGGRNGLYTQHLLESMRMPGLKVEDVFKHTRSAVRQASQGRQIPWETTSLEGDFYFLAPKASAPASTASGADTARAVEEAFWASVKASSDPADLRAFLARWPQGPHAALARERLAALALPPSPPVAAAQALRARSNAHGYTVGDKWNYQVVDRWKGEVVRNFTWVVQRIEPDGSWLSGPSKFDALGRPLRYPDANRALVEIDPPPPRWWGDMTVGASTRVNYDSTITTVEGARSISRWRSQARVVRRERIRVPAGEFDTLRIELQVDGGPTSGPGYGHAKITSWYAPELHTLVAFEQESFWNGKIDIRLREELTSLRLMNHPAYR